MSHRHWPKLIILKLSTRKSPGPGAFTGTCYKLFQKTEKVRTLPNSSCKAMSITPIPKQEKERRDQSGLTFPDVKAHYEAMQSLQCVSVIRHKHRSME
jgi:hypothetical protein